MAALIANPNMWYGITCGNSPLGVPAYLTPNRYVGGSYAGIGVNTPGLANPNMSEYPQCHWQFYPVT